MSQVYVEKRGRRITVRSPTPLPGFRSAIPGAYESVEGHWTVPLNLETCKLLRERYGRRLEVGPQLRRWAKGVRHARNSMKQLADAKDAKLTIVPKKAPKLYRAMRKRKYQCVGVRFSADNNSTLIADEPGLGKTLIAMGTVIEAEIPGPYLVIAPKTASETVWHREIQRWLPNPHHAILMPESRLARERTLQLALVKPHKARWIIVHPEMVMAKSYYKCHECGKLTHVNKRGIKVLSCKHIKSTRTKIVDDFSYPTLFKVNWGAIIVDESHDVLIMRSGTPTQRRNGLNKLSQRPDSIRLALSGTPFNNRPHQLWGTLNWLDSSTYSAFHRWAELFWTKTGYNGHDIGEFRTEREPLLWDSLSTIALRRTKIEVAKDLPPKTYVGTPLDPHDESSPVGVWLEMEDKQRTAYEQMTEQSMADLDSGRLEAISALAELTRLKQLACSYGEIDINRVRVLCQRATFPCMRDCGTWHIEDKLKYNPVLPSNKFTWTVNNLEEWGFPTYPSTKVVIVSFYSGLLRRFAIELENVFKTKLGQRLCTGITGRTPASKRRGIIDTFNRDGGPQIMMLNVKAGGTAITIDSADKTIFLSETRIPDQQTQAEDRTHRVSNPRRCFYYYLRSLHTVDVGTALINQELIQDSHRLLDNRRGVEYLREVLLLSR
jgi:SNF2 family DNA or RNA helicase